MLQALTNTDLSWCIRRLPNPVLGLMKARGPKLIAAGGFIRSCIAREPINDIDLFSPSREDAENSALKLCAALGGSPFETDNAYTVRNAHLPFPAQFIHRWTFARPEQILPSFDFTIASAAFWWAGESWESLIDDHFYADLAAKRLVYTQPLRNEDAGGSLLRVLKFYTRGYRIPLDAMAKVTARLMKGIDTTQPEDMIALCILKELRLVDPNVDPLNEGHDPATTTPPESTGASS